MSFLYGICLFLGLVCLLYYGIIVIYSGISTAFSWFWLCAGGGFIIAGLIIDYVIKQGIKIPVFMYYIAVAGIVLAILVFLIIEGMIIGSSRKKAEPEADYVIVLGAQVKKRVVSKSLKRRLDTAYEYLISNPNTMVVVSGGARKRRRHF